jgi:ABC-type sugar transport system ATPase subunit
MGMKRAEIDRQFDDIVEFSGLSEFIGTPVKRYSSGMSARLGFSIAAHLDPDVLLVDEVLSIGDFEFRQRAFARLQEMKRRGVPIVVVSHQLERIAEICTHGMLLSGGTVVRAGTPAQCIEEYVLGGRATRETAGAQLLGLKIGSRLPIRSGDRLRFSLAVALDERASGSVPRITVAVRSGRTGEIVSLTSTTRNRIDLPRTGEFALETELQMNVPPGFYLLETSLWDHRADREVETGPTAYLEVADGPSFHGAVQMNARMGVGRQ